MDLQASALNSVIEPLVGDDVIPLCGIAKNLEEAGEFERAAETLSGFWNGLISRPKTQGLDEEAKAELLLRAGTLTGWLGSAKQLSGAQESAKDLISESAAIFERLEITEKVAEARVDLAICYLREGGLDEARITLRLVLDSLRESASEQRLRALLNSAVIEREATRDQEALRICSDAAPLFAVSSNNALKGKFHNTYAAVLKSLGISKNREDYIDRALVEYTAAGYHLEQAGHRQFKASVENNVGFLFATIGRFDEAHEHLTRAHGLLLSVGDHGGAACAEDTRAQAFLLEGKYADAERFARRAVQALKRGGEQTVLAEALTTHGKALARLNQTHIAKTTLDQALEIAQTAGNPDRGGIAAITAIEELSDHLSVDALQNYYRTAETLLSNSQNLSIKNRLGECARRVLSVALAEVNASTSADSITMEPGFSLDTEVLRYEGDLIRRALKESGGSVTRAARLLGVTHQGLAFILNGRHSDLLSSRTPVKRRRRSIIRHH
ncbi:MAG TPA: tetratricopeptide repeat protein [Pyrinomonadaceae bacterium]